MGQRLLIGLFLLFAPAAPSASGEDVRGALDPGNGTLLDPGAGRRCGTLVINSDGSYESGCAWRGSGLQPPYSGAFAECYFGMAEVCAIVLDLTTEWDEPFPEEARLDAIVWEDDGGAPGNVLSLASGVRPGPVAHWPELSRHVFELPQPCCVGEAWWVGYWSDWPWEHSPFYWYIGADLNGPGGCPRTLIGPDSGPYPSGWQDVSVIWPPTAALGIGAEIRPCPPTPMRETTWGRIKSLYM